MKTIYLDWAATAPPSDTALTAFTQTARSFYGNPSSLHGPGTAAAARLEELRRALATRLRCLPDELIFTSGGTESNSLIIASFLERLQTTGKPADSYHVIAGGIEHPSVYENLEFLARIGVRVRYIPAAADGRIQADDVLAALCPDTVLVLVMLVSNITGSIQDLKTIAGGLRRYAEEHGRRIHLHSDGVQALGKIDLALDELGVDSCSFSAHKLGGLRGTGALFFAGGSLFHPLLRGGEQERGLRPGTENLPGIAALAEVTEERLSALAEDRTRTIGLMGRLIDALGSIPRGLLIPVDRANRLSDFSPYILCAAFPPVPSEVLIRVLASRGICVSPGSACSAKNREKQRRIYDALGISRQIADSAIRISLGPTSTAGDIETLVSALQSELPLLS